ncbi:hypothetical protein [Marinigracilibium pacificum]|uniref:Lipoprotein n=1 Tax=Marinigracilibium pacificum TaxID=2729599 RepID=A0A848IZ66_9BACT|nr:hypothetical protein [Marinigracilibium pacificum]NMM48926.1 hypothetical protein [Marinigracilibium pacificum]
MKIFKALLLFFVVIGFFASCGPKPYYKTSEGKKKQKRYEKTLYPHKDYYGH